MIERILVPLDGSAFGDVGVKAASSLARADRAEVLLVRVLTRDEADGRELEDAREHLRLRREELQADGVRARTLVATGEAAQEVLDAAASFAPSLIVISTHGRTGEKRWTRGSVAERILQRAKQPVLMVSPFAPQAERGFSRILVPVDGSPEAAAVLPIATDVARAHRAELLLLHVVDAADESARDVGARLVEHERAKVRGVGARGIVRTGPPAATILDVVDAERADLIALTTHGRSGTSRWLYGSVAELVIHHARTPLLVARTPA